MKILPIATWVAGTLLSLPMAAQTHTVFVSRGILADPGSAGTERAFKEVELADLNADGRLDLYLPSKQAGGGSTTPLPNRDVVFLTSSDDIILAVDSLGSKYQLQSTAATFNFPLDTSRAYDAELADLDGDGALDIIRPDRWGLLDVLWGHIDPTTGEPDGTFDQHTDVFDLPNINPNENCGAVGGNYDDVDVADFDGDGDLDFVVADRELDCGAGNPPPRNFIVENHKESMLPGQKPDFSIRSVSPPDGDELPAFNTHSIFTGNVDPPGALDVVAADFGDVRLYLGNDLLPFFFDAPQVLAGPHYDALPGAVRETVVADLVDLNRDGDLDLIVAENEIADVTHGVYFHSGNNSNPYPVFTDAPMIDYEDLKITMFFYGIYDARYGDLDFDGTVDSNGDGIPDDGTMEIMLVNQNVNNSGQVTTTVVQVVTVTSAGGLIDRTTTFMEPAETLTGGMGIDLGDLDGDGDPDMVLAGATDVGKVSQSSATVYENRTYTRLLNRDLASSTVIGIRELTAGTAVRVLSGRNVTFEADASVGGRILLQDGFHAVSGSTFTAQIR